MLTIINFKYNFDVNDFSEGNIRRNCPHCDPKSHAFKYPLETLDKHRNFYIVCDPHPLIEGHILIMPKEHLVSIANYSDKLINDFKVILEKVRRFVKSNYRSESVFEHGGFGQTVFHSHIHILPFKDKPEAIVPEGNRYIRRLENFEDLKKLYNEEGGYLLFTTAQDMWTVDPKLTTPRFFRDRYAKALGRPERGNWKEAHDNEQLMQAFDQECKALQLKWRTVKPLT